MVRHPTYVAGAAPEGPMRRRLRLALASTLTAALMIVLFVGPLFLGYYLSDASWVPFVSYTAWIVGLAGPLIVVIWFCLRKSTRRFAVATAVGWAIGIAFFIALGVVLTHALE